MTETLDVYAGYCTTRFTTARGRDDGEPSQRIHRGRVVAVRKPDDTLLVHDADGYQPVAWLTRPEAVWIDESPDGDASTDGTTTDSPDDGTTEETETGVKLVAVDGDEQLTVRFDPEPAVARHAVSAAGTPVGTCHCEGELVATGGEVTCLDCEEAYALPRGGQIADTTCDACGLPELSVQRGEQFRVCLDRNCRPLSAAVAAALDGRVDCPDCSASLRVEQHRGRQFLGCDDYPDCEATFSIPAGVIVGTCACGLPVFDRGTDRRCLDAACPHDGPAGESEPDTVEETGVDAIVGTELEESAGSEELVEGEEARDD